MHIRLFYVIIALFIAPFQAQAIEVTAQGANERQAINNALRQAVEMTMGVNIESNTLVENFQVVRQQILSHSSGYISGYKILSRQNEPTGLMTVTLDATVDDTAIVESTQALSTLMKMAANPRVLVAGLHEDFDAISSLSDEFRTVQESLESLLREDFKFSVIDREAARLQSGDSYKYSDRKNILKRAQQAKADYVLFIEVLKKSRQRFTLKLEATEVSTQHALSKNEKTFTTRNWTRNDQNTRATILREAAHQIHGPGAQTAAALVENIRKEVYEDGQRFELSFSKFKPELISRLETDLSTIEGYVRHKIERQQKNALVLSYWSLMKAGPLQETISGLLQSHETTFQTRLQGRTIQYRFKDPVFE